jgi:hypothetical protein
MLSKPSTSKQIPDGDLKCVKYDPSTKKEKTKKKIIKIKCVKYRRIIHSERFWELGAHGSCL